MRILLRAVGEGKVDAPDQILGRWTWRLARATRKVQDRRASAEFPEAKRLLGAVANSRGHRHEENVGRLVQVARALPLDVGAALLASSEGYTPRANQALDAAREELAPIRELANALADNLPAREGPGPQVAPPPQEEEGRRRRRGRPAGRLRERLDTGRRRSGSRAPAGGAEVRRRRRRRPKPSPDGTAPTSPQPAPTAANESEAA